MQMSFKRVKGLKRLRYAQEMSAALQRRACTPPAAPSPPTQPPTRLSLSRSLIPPVNSIYREAGGQKNRLLSKSGVILNKQKQQRGRRGAGDSDLPDSKYSSTQRVDGKRRLGVAGKARLPR